MSLHWEVKSFETLTVHELYDILRLRSEIFVVEQNCVYLDLDGKDKNALHLFGTFDGSIVAHARLFPPGVTFNEASIGRVVVATMHRDRKWGHDLMQSAIDGIATHFGEKRITIGAQLYLKKFYESHGFVALGEVYLEDDIPHIIMKRE